MNQKCDQHLRRAHDLMQMQQSFGVGPIRHVRRRTRAPGYVSKSEQPLQSWMDSTIAAQDRYWMNSMTLQERSKNRKVKEMQLYINCSEEAALKYISPRTFSDALSNALSNARKLSNALYGADPHKDGLTDLLNKALEKKFKSWTWVNVEYVWKEGAPVSKPTTAKLVVEFSITPGNRWSNYNTLHQLRKESDRYYPDPEELQLIQNTVQECFDSLPQLIPDLSFLSPIQLTDVRDKTRYHSYALIQKVIREDHHDLHETVKGGDRSAGARRRRFHKQ